MIKTVSFSKNVTNVFFHILTKCNLTCQHCYINTKQHGTETLPLSTITSWLKLFATYGKKTNLILLGGEPTLHPELSTVIKTAKNLGYSSITVDTNGYLFNDIIVKIDPCETYCLSFSLDGATRKTNDMIRGKGSYDTCIAGIKKAVAKGFKTSLIYTVSTMNIGEIDLMVPLLNDLGIKHFFIQVIGLRGRLAQEKDSKHHTDLQVPRTTWLNTIPLVAKKISNMGITVSYPKVYLRSNEPFECAGVVADNYFIFPNGRVYRCPICEDFPVHSMKIQDNRLIKTKKINEDDFFQLNIPEGCVMNRLIQPENITYQSNGLPEYKIACCLLKEEIDNKKPVSL
jgi:MoaA/NifB/PqqE/SkfB family radical SAM enzyme